MSENGPKRAKNSINMRFTISFSLFTVELTNLGEIRVWTPCANQPSDFDFVSSRKPYIQN